MFGRTVYIKKPRVCQLENADRRMFGDMFLTYQTIPSTMNTTNETTIEPLKVIQKVRHKRTKSEECCYGVTRYNPIDDKKRRASLLIDQLLCDIYGRSLNNLTDYNSATSSKSQKIFIYEKHELERKNPAELSIIINGLNGHVSDVGKILVRQLKRRDAIRRQIETQCDVITRHLRKRYTESADMHFSLEPGPGDSGFNQWRAAMKMVAQLPEGIPPEFRRRLWLTLADKHLSSKRIDWRTVEKNCFSEWSHPDDSELGVQIVKDLHRTGCSLFCGEDGQENQALLKRVLLAYARWNKAVGYCQGFNMLAALILQVTERCESDALKLMIYLIEGVLPDSYFADSLRGLSVDMAVFRELLRSKLPRLSRHLDALQTAAKEGTTSYEPPLTNVFTMQWFLTLFCNCLPQPTVLRVWDLILLEGNEILLRTALAIWQALADRIMAVRSADEFYSIMGVLTREMLEFGILDANLLIKSVVMIGPLDQLKTLRERYLYNINPWNTSNVAPSIPPPPPSSRLLPLSRPSHCDAIDSKHVKLYSKEKLVLDIGVLKKQYAKLKQRQRQAHIIFNAAVTRQRPSNGSTNIVAPVAVNHLLLGKNALVSSKRLGPPKGAVPPPRTTGTNNVKKVERKPSERPKSPPIVSSSSSSSSDTELCDDPVSDDSLNDSDAEGEPVALTDTQSLDNLAKSAEPEPDVAANPLETDGIHLIPPSSSSSRRNSCNAETDAIDVTRSESVESDDTFEFERFLEERIRCLKDEDTAAEDDVTDCDRIRCGRKNSERALQIMQENSLILHRILQCQSRSATPFAEEASTSMANENPENPVEDDVIIALEIEESPRKLPATEDVARRALEPLDGDSISTSPSPERRRNVKEPEELAGKIDRLSLDDLLEDNLEAMRKSLTTPDTPKSETERPMPASTNVQERLLAVESNIREAGDYLKHYRNKIDMRNSSVDVLPNESKYERILSYSKDLDDRYRNLILNQSKEIRETVATNDDVGNVGSRAEEARINLSLETDRFDVVTEGLQLNDVLLGRDDNCLNDKDQEDAFLVAKPSVSIERDDDVDGEIVQSSSSMNDFDISLENVGKKRTTSSPNRIDETRVSSVEVTKSPKRSIGFDPFPIGISQRQNRKDVALKLGLYNNNKSSK